MDISHLTSFYEVVQRGSFSAAADALGVSKGMLSRHVSALESALNAQLLQRTTRRLSLTEAGRTLYVQAGQIAALARQAVGEAANAVGGFFPGVVEQAADGHRQQEVDEQQAEVARL